MSQFVVVELTGNIPESVTGPFVDADAARRWLGFDPDDPEDPNNPMEEIYILILKTPIFSDEE